MTLSVSSPSLSKYKTLINQNSWDDYNLESLLPLKETYRENTEFGFLMRHYWIPATELRFRQSSRTTAPDGTVKEQELWIDRQMARCRSNECTWREKVYSDSAINGKGSALKTSSPISEMLCSYDCYDQTYTSAEPILFELLTDDQKMDARRQALYRLPMLVPPGPVPIGFTWYAKVGDDYMNFCLEAEKQVGETSILVVRREGRYTTWLSTEAIDTDNDSNAASMITERQGVTLLAWNRGVVLEDRFKDQVVDAGDLLISQVGTTSQAVTRLIRSCPAK